MSLFYYYFWRSWIIKKNTKRTNIVFKGNYYCKTFPFLLLKIESMFYFQKKNLFKELYMKDREKLYFIAKLFLKNSLNLILLVFLKSSNKKQGIVRNHKGKDVRRTWRVTKGKTGATDQQIISLNIMIFLRLFCVFHVSWFYWDSVLFACRFIHYKLFYIKKTSFAYKNGILTEKKV